MKINLILSFVLLLLISCGEESLTVQNKTEKFSVADVQFFELNTCSQMHFEKPPVDVLYIVDNSGSTLADSFQAIKGQIKNTINHISNEFDYHIYVAPLNAVQGDNIQTYPLIVSDTNTLPNIASLNIVNSDNLEMFSPASGNNTEYGFTRAYNIIQNNRSNGIFRENANTVIVMISNGDDTETLRSSGGNVTTDPNKYEELKNKFLSLTKKYSSTHSVSNPLNTESLRFISLVAHNRCNGWVPGSTYRMMSKDIYEYQNFSDNSAKDSMDLCSGNYSQLFSAINSSIRAVLVGHKYNYWKISSASESNIQADDILVTKINADQSRTTLSEDVNNGFQYIGYKSNQNTRYAPSVGEPKSGLFIQLNGNARVEYPECIIAKTRTPTEYFGYIALPREPDLSTVKIEIDGKAIPKSVSQGWTYLGFRDTLNIKVPGPTGASVTPEVKKSGYFLQLHGSAIFTNGQTVNVYYKPKTK